MKSYSHHDLYMTKQRRKNKIKGFLIWLVFTLLVFGFIFLALYLVSPNSF